MSYPTKEQIRQWWYEGTKKYPGSVGKISDYAICQAVDWQREQDAAICESVAPFDSCNSLERELCRCILQVCADAIRASKEN